MCKFDKCDTRIFMEIVVNNSVDNLLTYPIIQMCLSIHGTRAQSKQIDTG